MSAITKNLWASKIKPTRGKPWIIWPDVRSTRREAKRAFLEGIDPEFQKKHLERVEFVRVFVQEQQP